MVMEKSSFSMGVFSQVFPEFQKIDVSFNISMFPGGSSYLRQYIHIYIYIRGADFKSSRLWNLVGQKTLPK